MRAGAKTRTHAARLLALALATTMIPRALGAPADITEIAAPSLGADPPKAQDIATGDVAVATKTGALTYSFPVRVPPGRNGMAPSLSLDYSSQAAIYGGVASGWSLAIPEIRWDTSKGRIRHFDQVAQEWNDEPYVSSLSGGRPLFRTNEAAPTGSVGRFRAKNDGAFISYQRQDWIIDPSVRWIARSPDGTTYRFGEGAYITNTSSIQMRDLTRIRAPLTRMVDQFGNTVEYRWKFDGEELRIESIDYTTNTAVNGGSPFARVVFTYAAAPVCAGSPVGAQLDYTTGLRLVEGKSKLTQITATAFDPGTSAIEHTRQITLGYSTATESCNNNAAPYRQLVSIQESGWHANAPSRRVDLPAVTFGYGAANGALASASPQTLWTGGPMTANLGWGHRYDNGRWPSVEAMMVDFDGDGLVDRIENTTPELGNECTVHVLRNDGHGNFNHLTDLTLPRMPWASGTKDPVSESCAVNYQHTKYTNVTPFECGPSSKGSYLTYRWLDMTGDGRPELVTALSHSFWFDPDLTGAPTPTGQTWPSCTGDHGACPALEFTCMAGARTCEQGKACTVNPATINSCIANAPYRNACSDMGQALRVGDNGGVSQPGEAGCFSGEDNVVPYKRCGLYPWGYYLNTGLGLASTPVMRLQPVHLESDSGDSNVSAGTFYGFQHGTFDIDGDGFVDSITRGRFAENEELPPNILPHWWWAFLGDGAGSYLKDGAGEFRRFYFDVPNDFYVSNDDKGESPGGGLPPTTIAISQTQQLQDINGDGLVDYLNNIGPSIGAHFADGLKIRASGTPTNAIGPDFVMTPAIASPTVSSIAVSAWDSFPGPGFLVAGTRTAGVRMLDLDQDGRPDLFRAGAIGSPSHVAYNAGADILAFQTATAALIAGAKQTVSLTGQVDFPTSYLWEAKGDLLDLDGDGIPESLDFSSGTQARAVYNPNGQPPRLMTQVTNGRGLTTNIRYAALSDNTVVDNAQTASGTTASPRTQWVVKSLETIDQFESSNGSSTYFYNDPAYVADDEGRYAFRGFREIKRTNSKGGKTIERYGFGSVESPDWSGRLVSTITALADDSAISIVDQTWQAKTLFAGKLVTYHPLRTIRAVCGAGQTEAQCRASAAARAITDSTWEPLPAGSGVLYVETLSTTQDGPAFDDGDRKTVTTYALLDGPNGPYRVRATASSSYERVAGSDQLFAHTETYWGTDLRVPLDERVQLDAIGTLAVTARTFDAATGNLLTVKKPVQVAASDTRTTTNTYDSRKLLVATEANELNQPSDYTYEYGTGAVVLEQGPNQRNCAVGCPPGDLPVREGKRVTVDGLGRPRDIEITSLYPGYVQSYQWSKIETYAYIDTPTVSVPAYVVHEQRIEFDENRWTTVQTDLDGHGRPITIREKVNGTAGADAVTSFDYDAEGQVVSVSVPDPTLNTSAQVAFTYAFDAINRPTGMRRPDATPQSGVDVVYSGLDETRTEVAGAGGVSSQPAQTKLSKDAFGRLVAVRERTAVSPDVFALTTYAYSPRDEVKTIVGPTGITTLLEHDLGGRRTKITRGSSVWKYTYDRNGNLIAEAAPPPTPALEADWTTMYVYDVLDRPTSKAIAPRDLSLPDRDLFGAGTATYEWDTGGLFNRVGRLVFYRTFQATAGQPEVFRGRYFYDPEGQTRIDARQWSVKTPETTVAIPERQEAYRFAPFGKIGNTVTADEVPGNPVEVNTSYFTRYDDRGNAKDLLLVRAAMANKVIGTQTRNVAGLVTKRSTTQTGVAMTLLESNWTYDKLGRITQQLVQKTGNVQIARQDLAYWGNDDPKQLDQWFDTSNHKRFAYTYDHRHQLLGTIETLAGGAFAQTNQYTTDGRLQHATVTPTALTGREARPRNVDYVYGGPDPEAVTALNTPTAGGPQPYAAYTYDTAGNQTSRTYYTDASLPTPLTLGTPQTWTFVYDGEDQLRRVTSPAGTGQTIEEYWYDQDGKRALIRTRLAAGGSPVTWRWFHNNTEIEFQTPATLTDPTLTQVKTYAYASLGTPVARIQNRNDRTEFQFHGLGSSTLATVESGIGDDPTAPASGTTNTAFTYSPFGEVLEVAGSEAATHRRRMNDKYQDAASGLGYYGFRYYDPVAMTWTQSDPLFRFSPDSAWREPRRAGLYVNDLQNPLRYVDPDGQSPRKAGEAVMRLGAELARSGASSGNRVTTFGGIVVIGAGAVLFVGAELFAPVDLPRVSTSAPTPPGSAWLDYAAADATVAAALGSGAMMGLLDKLIDKIKGDKDKAGKGPKSDGVPEEANPNTDKHVPLPPPYRDPEILKWPPPPKPDPFGPYRAHADGSSPQVNSTATQSQSDQPTDAQRLQRERALEWKLGCGIECIVRADRNRN